MILNDPFTSNMIASRLLQIMIEATQTSERFGQVMRLHSLDIFRLNTQKYLRPCIPIVAFAEHVPI